MPVLVACPKCRGKIELDPSDTDQRMQCPLCSAIFVIKKKPTQLHTGDLPTNSTAVTSVAPSPPPPSVKPPDGLPAAVDEDRPPKKYRDEDDEDDDRPRKKRRDEDDEEDDDDRPRKKRRDEDDEEDDDDRPRKKRRDEDDEDDDDRPRRKRRDEDDEDDDDRPRKKRRDEDDEDDDDPPRKKRRDEDDEEDDDRPRKKRRDDDDEDDDDRPRKKRRDEDDEDDDDRPRKKRRDEDDEDDDDRPRKKRRDEDDEDDDDRPRKKRRDEDDEDDDDRSPASSSSPGKAEDKKDDDRPPPPPAGEEDKKDDDRPRKKRRDEEDEDDDDRPRKKRRDEDDEEDDDDRPRKKGSDENDEDKERRKRRSKKKKQKKNSAQLYVFLGVGAFFVLALIGFLVWFFFIRSPSTEDAGGTSPKPAASGGGTEITLTNGTAEVKSELTTSDPQDTVKKKSRCKVFKIKLNSGKKYQIDMTSTGDLQKTGIRCFMRLADSAGESLNESSDRGIDARIIFQCKKDDTYRIIATTHDSAVDESKVPPGAKVEGIGVNRTGPFTLTVRDDSPEASSPSTPQIKGGSEREKIWREGISAGNDIAGVLETVKDSASAKAAAPKIELIIARMQELKKKDDALPKLSPDEDARLKKKMEPEQIAFNERMNKAGMQAGQWVQKEPTLMNAFNKLATLK